jgi:CubicO group peptidase (beta-lactamase class C family)
MMGVLVQGHCDPRFEKVQATLQASLDSGADLGASVAVTFKDELVVDLYGGHLDEDKTQPWQADTIVNVYSTTKTMSFLCMLILADRKALDFDENVAAYWPEFAANGKETVKVWHLMNHAAGLSGMDTPVSSEDMYDWEKITSLLAAQAPWWEPGSATGYHALTQGYLLGEVLRRITGQTMGTFFKKEVADKLGVDFHIGVPDEALPRIGHLLPPPVSTLGANSPNNSVAARTFANPAGDARDSWTLGWKQAEIPAANGHGNARSVAKIHAVLANLGESQGVRLLSEETARSVVQPRISGNDLALGMPLSYSLGFGMPPGSKRKLCYWGGWGGSTAIIDQEQNFSISYVMNKMHPGLMGDERGIAISQAVFTSLVS